MARISLCLIARNEEEMLPGCLESVRGAVDEVVLVDTGSTDRTVELARAAGATVLERPWDDDFSAPRNLAARHARGDFLLVMDADERLAPGAGKRLRQAVRDGRFELGMVRLHNAARKDAPAEEIVAGAARIGSPIVLPRVVRNAEGLEWRGVIHESVGDWLLRTGGRRVTLDVDLVHLGYLPGKLIERDKRERNIRLLRRRVELEPGDVTPHGYLAIELMESGRFAEAAQVVDEAWSRLDAQPAWRCFHRIAVAGGLLAIRAADGARAGAVAARAEAHNGPHPDFDYLRGFGREIEALAAAPRSPERARLLADAAASYASALHRLEGDGPFEFLGMVNPVRARLHLGVVRILEGHPQEALREFSGALRLEADNPSALVGAAEALVDLGDPGRALRVVEKALGERPDGWLVAAAAAHGLGAAADARLFLARARERLGKGYECLHRRARQEGLERALAG